MPGYVLRLVPGLPATGHCAVDPPMTFKPGIAVPAHAWRPTQCHQHGTGLGGRPPRVTVPALNRVACLNPPGRQPSLPHPPE